MERPPAPPVVPENSSVLTQQIEEGNGERVQAGDLVELEVVVLTRSLSYERAELSPEPHTIWVWTGSDEGDPRQAGYLGTEAVRRTLIGRRIGERFELIREPCSRGGVVLPIHGLIGPLSPYDRLNETLSYKGRVYRPREWRQLDLEPQGYGPAWGQLEILGRVSQREALLPTAARRTTRVAAGDGPARSGCRAN